MDERAIFKCVHVCVCENLLARCSPTTKKDVVVPRPVLTFCRPVAVLELCVKVKLKVEENALGVAAERVADGGDAVKLKSVGRARMTTPEQRGITEHGLLEKR